MIIKRKVTTAEELPSSVAVQGSNSFEGAVDCIKDMIADLSEIARSENSVDSDKAKDAIVDLSVVLLKLQD